MPGVFYVSHGAAIRHGTPEDSDKAHPGVEPLLAHGSPWFVVEPIENPLPQVKSLLKAKRVVLEITIEPGQWPKLEQLGDVL